MQESGGDPNAYSSSGAVGLMQVMPRDGIAAEFMCVNGPCFAARPTIAELKVPVFNIQYGSQFLAGLVQKHSSYREALYKYGPIDIGYHYADLVLSIWDAHQ
jgi:soluble lytic murein transglycosylase-like protein